MRSVANERGGCGSHDMPSEAVSTVLSRGAESYEIRYLTLEERSLDLDVLSCAARHDSKCSTSYNTQLMHTFLFIQVPEDSVFSTLCPLPYATGRPDPQHFQSRGIKTTHENDHVCPPPNHAVNSAILLSISGTALS